MRVAVGQAKIELHGHGRVLLVTATGLVTASAIEAIRRAVAPHAASAGAVCVDYTRTVVAVSDQELQALVAPIAAGHKSVPMSWAVAADGVADLWGRQSLRLALLGHRRFVGLGLDVAADWAHRQALLATMPAMR